MGNVVKLVHAADLHVDSPQRGLERYAGAPLGHLRHATRRAFSNVIRLCLDEQVDLLLLAGDLFDGSWRDFGTGLFFAAELAKLREIGTRVVLVRGNHDAASVVTEHLRLADHVTELSTRKPESFVDERLGVAVHGQGYKSRATRDDLAARYPSPLGGLLNVGLLHTSLDGRRGHEPYAPTRKDVLIDRGYAYWALGHVHAREVVSSEPWIVFPGNVQGRHARETGPKGVTLITAENGRIVSVEERLTDVVRWVSLEVSADDAAVPDDVLDLVRESLSTAIAASDDRPLAVRLAVGGLPREGSQLHARQAVLEDELRLHLASEHGARVFAEKIRVRFAESGTARETEGRLLVIDGEDLDEERVELERDLAELEKKLPAELRDRARGEWLDEALSRAVALVREAETGRTDGR